MEFTLRQVRYFIAVAETGQISKAALRCNISQSSMTIALKGLEEALGTTLFSRHAKGLRLSDAGERFLRHAQQIDAAARQAGEDMRERPVPLTGTLRVGVTDTISAYLMPSLRLGLKRRFPDLELILSERERVDVEQAIADGELDLGIVLVSNAALRDDIEGETLLRSARQLWVAPDHPLAATANVTLEDVSRQEFLMLDMDEHVQTAQRYWEQWGLVPSVTFQSKSIEGIRSMVALGIGVTILSDLVYRPWSLEGGRIVRRPVVNAVPTMDVGVIWLKSAGFPHNGQSLRDFLRVTLREPRE
ncbi:LysR family transcriptional regulator [Paraburkholderia sp. BCC1886]|uniref:LysR family transcriptional regulator n=1 Tax=Paraburkholderia sp. BCC1886 TaxID=2562670 RepID=UPI001182907E|nr:LysR family transcriptional regulator [Paraburkholderia sp. BCC1886]